MVEMLERNKSHAEFESKKQQEIINTSKTVQEITEFLQEKDSNQSACAHIKNYILYDF